MAHRNDLTSTGENEANALYPCTGDCAARLHSEASVHAQAYERSWQPDSLDKAIFLLWAAVRRTSPQLALSINILSLDNTLAFEDLLHLSGCQHSTLILPEVAFEPSHLPPLDPEASAKVMLELCRLLRWRIPGLGKEDDIQALFTLSGYVLEHLSPGHPMYCEALRSRGHGHFFRYLGLKARQTSDMEEALYCFRQAAVYCHRHGHICVDCLVDLGWALHRSEHDLPEQPHLTEAISLFCSALGLCLASKERGKICVYLGIANTRRFHLRKDLEYGKQANLYLAEGVVLLDPNHPLQSLALHNIGVARLIQFEQTSKLDVLKDSIKALKLSLSLRAPGHPSRDETLRKLVVALTYCYDQEGDRDALSDAVLYSRMTIDSTPFITGWSLSSHALLLHTSFGFTGEIGELEEAIDLFRQALTLISPEQETYAVTKHNLGGALVDYYQYSGESEPLIEAEKHLWWTLEQRPPGHSRRILIVIDYGEVLQHFYHEFGDTSSLANAITLYEDGIKNESVTSFAHGVLRYQHATALHACHFSALPSEAVLDRSIEQYHYALSMISPGHHERHLVSRDAASALADRFAEKGDVNDMLKAIDLQTKELNSLAVGHPGRCPSIFGLARLYLTKLNEHDMYGHDKAVQLLLEGLRDQGFHAQDRLEGSLSALSKLSCFIPGAVAAKMLDIYWTTVSLLPKVAFLTVRPSTRLSILKKAHDLAANASLWAIKCGNNNSAIELLEEGRAVFWSQLLKLRQITFDRMPKGLAQQLSTVAEELRSSARIFNEANAHNHYVPSDATKLRQLGEKFESLVEHARLLPGQECFLMPSPFKTLAHIASKSPVAVLVASQMGCYALLMTNSHATPYALQLKNISVGALRDFADVLQRNNANGRNAMSHRAVQVRGASNAVRVLRDLWIRIMQPIILHMNIERQTGLDRPRLFICSTGAFTHLPLHAAGIHSSSQPLGCSNYCVISYTPTLSALLSARNNATKVHRRDIKVLIAAVSQPYAGPRLHLVEREAEIVQSTMQEHAPTVLGIDVLEHEGATTRNVLNLLPHASILHMACHGQQDMHDSLKSGFLMRDSMLTVAQLMDLELPSAFLAFLSACDTAKGDSTQPDQAIHLAAAMLYAGFKSVVATMWSMSDADGPIVAKTVYETLYSGTSEYLNVEAVPYALDEAVGKLRARGLHSSRWAPYIHIGI